jgi:hypothetical protein
MFWLREIFGWILIVVSLIVLRIGLKFALNTEEPQIVEASLVLFAALGVMRSGILLIRISTAARICQIDREPR